jgi:peptidoglycan/xylan/chitin deacetylase (PgdA/CDA1 family)
MDDMPFCTMPNKMTLQQIKQAQQIDDTILSQITRLQTPVAAFIIGDQCISANETDLRLDILKSWLYNPYITVGNHTLHHLNHAENDLDCFKEEVIVNDYLLKSFMKDSTIKYFRFPYNALGKDSISQKERADYLSKKGYTIAPFTIDADDWVINILYKNELKKNNTKRADSIARVYIKFTVDLFQYFEQLSQKLYGRNINQILLCHANKLSADYYTILINELKNKGYHFISLEDALKDKVFSQPNYYFGKWGISWIYRWIKDKQERNTLMKKEIDYDKKLYEEYQSLVGEKK